MPGSREVLNDRLPISPVSVVVLSMLNTPAFTSVSLGAGWARREREAAVTPETLLALLFRPEMLETGSVTGMMPPIREEELANERLSKRLGYPSECERETG